MTNERTFDYDAAFQWWYNTGFRRTKADTAREFGVSYSRIKQVAVEYEWDDRAETLDREIQIETNKRLVGMRARVNKQIADGAALGVRAFVQQLQSGTLTLDVADFERFVRIWNIANGQATELVGQATNMPLTARTLEEIESELAKLPEQERDALTRALPAPGDDGS